MRWMWRVSVCCALASSVAACCNQTECFGSCVDLMTSHEDCGACFNPCNAQETCVLGVCTCPEGLSSCGERCVATDTTEHCGRCNNRCASGASCEGGMCACPVDVPDRCGDRCVDLAGDVTNCGVCGFACPDVSECVAGDCACPGIGGLLCDGVCVDPASDAAHCGGCGVTCTLGCADGACRTVVDMDIGLDHLCVLLSDGTVRCEGQNAYGQLGLGSDVSSRRFTEVALPIAITDIATGSWHTCAIGEGATYCWGQGEEGQIGRGVSEARVYLPARVPTAPSAPSAVVAHWDAACVIGGDRSLWCWGRNQQLGGGTGYHTSPTLVSSGPVDLVELSSAHVCYRNATSRAVTCESSYLDRIDPTAFTGTTDMAGGSSHVCALVAGDVLCAGRNSRGQLGNGTIGQPSDPPVATPVRARVPERAIDVGASTSSTCALGVSGAVYCWGSNSNPYVLGEDDSYGSSVPVRVEGVLGEQLFMGDNRVCVIANGDEVTCWGASILDYAPRRVSL